MFYLAGFGVGSSSNAGINVVTLLYDYLTGFVGC